VEPVRNADDPVQEATIEAACRVKRRLRLLLGVATAGMLALSWPLWVGTAEFPKVPFFAGRPEYFGTVGWLLFGSLFVAVLLTGLARRWRGWFALSVALFGVFWLEDQHRFQPWSYQYVMTGMLLAALPAGDALRYARWWYVALYAHSGLSKLDASFCNELGLRFLGTAAGLFGLDPLNWSGAGRVAAVLAMPVFEIAIAASLAWPSARARRLGVTGATVLHLALIGILGPAGLGHSGLVLLWNGAMMVEVWSAFAFGPELAGRAVSRPPGGLLSRLLAVLARAVFWVGVLLPFGERFGVFDAWPSHALYASHVERLTVDLHEGELSGYPASVRNHLLAGGDGPWRRLDLTGWSRAERGTPVYPQNRAGLGLAEGLAARYGDRGLVRVTLYGPADRWTGRRPRTELVGLEAIRRQGDRYRLNAHPSAVPDEIPRSPNGPKLPAPVRAGREREVGR
jgi:hypothetical protein